MIISACGLRTEVLGLSQTVIKHLCENLRTPESGSEIEQVVRDKLVPLVYSLTVAFPLRVCSIDCADWEASDEELNRVPLKCV